MNSEIVYSLSRSRRTTLSLGVTKQGEVVVRAPIKMRKADIDRFVLSRESWILEHVTLAKRRLAAQASFSLTYGDTVPLCGKTYPIAGRDGQRIGFDGREIYMPAGLDNEAIKSAVIQVYRYLAADVIGGKVKTYASQMGLTPTSMRITGAATRWGSCSGANSINFSWRLMMASEDVIDYVVVHELAHIAEHNHSERFWALVKRYMPDYQARREELRSLQEQLSVQNWD